MSRKSLLQRELQRVTRLIVRRYKPDRIILFGSLAAGKVHEWSDIDLAIVKNTRRRFIDRIGDVFRLAHPKVALNVVVYTPREVKGMLQADHYFWVDEIAGKGKILYDRAA